MDELTEAERDLLVFERGWWKYAGAKEAAIRDQFGFSASRYYQALGAVIEKPAALVFDPVLVKRLRRLRETRALARERPRRSPEGAGNAGASSGAR